MRMEQVAFAGLSLLLSGAARAQVYAPSSPDPCSQPRFLGGVSTACLAERNAQWKDYYARQLQQAADAKAEAEQQRTRQEADAARLATEEQERERQAREEARQEAKQRYIAYAQMQAAEASPANRCKTPEIARMVLSQWNDFSRFKAENLEAIDIEHLTTDAFDENSGVIACHGVFVTNQGGKLIGTFSTRKNVAGDPIASWRPDESQDLSKYSAVPDPDPVSRQATSSVQTIADTGAAAEGSSGGAGSFAAGLASRKEWEGWITTLTDDERNGAVWWASNRNSPRHATCDTAPQKDDATWKAGCLNAVQKLTPVDAKRRIDPQYKKGWNSL